MKNVIQIYGINMDKAKLFLKLLNKTGHVVFGPDVYKAIHDTLGLLESEIEKVTDSKRVKLFIGVGPDADGDEIVMVNGVDDCSDEKDCISESWYPDDTHRGEVIVSVPKYTHPQAKVVDVK